MKDANSNSTKNFNPPPKIDSIQNVVQNAQKLVDNIGKQRSTSKEIGRQRPEYDFRGSYMRNNYMNNQAAVSSFKEGGYKSDNTTIEQSMTSGAGSSMPHQNVAMHGGQYAD